MNNDSSKEKLITNLIIFVVIISGIYGIASAFITINKTGTLNVTATRSAALISISAANKQAKVVGTGTAHLRLRPGTYQLVAAYNGSQTTSLVKVSKKQSSSVSLNLAKTSLLPSPASINFQNMYWLTAQGITQTQASTLQDEFFELKPSAHTVAIDASSVKSGVINPGPGVPLTLSFNVTVDGAPYKAVASYLGFENIRLQLYTPTTGAQVFDSDTAKNPLNRGD